MSSIKLIAATALMAALPSALAGNAIINNHCNFPVYITPSQSGTDAAQQEYGPGQTFNEPISGEAVCLKVMTQKGFCMTDNCVQLEYTSDAKTLWYDLSNINAGTLQGLINHGMTVNATGPDAKQIDCPPGQSTSNNRGCTSTYYEWFENINSLAASPNSDLTMNLCTANLGSNSGSNSGSFNPLASFGHGASSAASSVAASVAAPAAPVVAPAYSAAAPAAPQVSAAAPSAAPAAPTHAPIIPEVMHGANGPEVIVTVTQTMMAREEETAAPEKRHIHAHAHHHRH